MVAFIGGLVMLCPRVEAQQLSQGGMAIEVEESREALNAALERMTRLELQTERLRESNNALARGLAAANEEAQAVREAHRELRLEIEALGINLLDTTDGNARRSLLEALATLDDERGRREAVEKQLLQLVEVVAVYLERGEEDDAARLALEARLRHVDRVLAPEIVGANAVAEVPGLRDARVVSIQPELGLVVLNVGRKSGVKIGMPFEILQNDRTVAPAMVVDVRNDVCGLALGDGGAAIAELQVGDQARPASF